MCKFIPFFGLQMVHRDIIRGLHTEEIIHLRMPVCHRVKLVTIAGRD